MSEKSTPVRLIDYEPYDWTIKETQLHLSLYDDHTIVESELQFERTGEKNCNLRLHGSELELMRVAVDGRELSNNEYSVDDESLTIFGAPDDCVVAIQNKIHPETNTKLHGLYRSGGLYCTQCEPESFRNITFYPDRPDVSAEFFTTIEADREKFPILLSNGNLIHDKSIGESRHQATWHDPFPKPSYLFALVGGDLATIEDSFQTKSGRLVQLNIYSEQHNIDKCYWAMECLKKAMQWDEDKYGREYDLDRFMIVAVENFNFGAMENKGLNIFNVAVLLANPDIATDADYWRIEGVVAHEYFHNWSGNRVTCRDWFQLSLKEGFTVFRDTTFSEDIHGTVPIRISTVNRLRDVQFPEDGGALAHPVRPSSYESIDNFYTPTVYEKGAEVVRMLSSMVGDDVWRKATDRYFETFDNQAVRVEDFVACVESESGLQLDQFFRWYDQAGTPNISVQEQRSDDSLTLHLEQSCRATPECEQKQPFHIPLALGIIDGRGRDVLGKAGKDNGYRTDFESASHISNPNEDGTLILNLKQEKETVRFDGIPEDSVVSFHREFSAPVEVRYKQDLESRITLALKDSDGFNRWNAARSILIEAIHEGRGEDPLLLDFERILIEQLLNEKDERRRTIALSSLKIPLAINVLESHPGLQFEELLEKRTLLRRKMAKEHLPLWNELLNRNSNFGAYDQGDEEVSRRSVYSLALSNIRVATTSDQEQGFAEFLAESFNKSNNLTDRVNISSQLIELSEKVDKIKESVVAEFLERFKDESLVVNHWFRLQAQCTLAGAIERIRKLNDHPQFSLESANLVRALFNTFAYFNEANFHHSDGTGYTLIAEKVNELDEINPSTAASLAKTLTGWLKFDERHQRLMKDALRLIETKAESAQVKDVVKRGLA